MLEHAPYGFSAHDWTRQDRAYARRLTDQAPPLIPDETVLEPRSETAPGASPSSGAASDRAPARVHPSSTPNACCLSSSRPGRSLTGGPWDRPGNG